MGGSNDINGQQYYTGNGYVSTSFMFDQFARLSGTWQYISSTTLYDVINRLGHLKFIGDDLGPMSFIGSNYNENVGYVSTAHCGEYRVYRSTMTRGGLNIIEQTNDNNLQSQSVIINIGGYSNHVVSTSKMVIDVDINMRAEYKTGLHTAATFSNFLKHSGTQQPIGTQVVYDLLQPQSTLQIGRMSFMLQKEDLFPFPQNVTLIHMQSNTSNDALTMTTNCPLYGGVRVILDNMD
jgi:hypothetical protein